MIKLVKNLFAGAVAVTVIVVGMFIVMVLFRVGSGYNECRAENEMYRQNSYLPEYFYKGVFGACMKVNYNNEPKCLEFISYLVSIRAHEQAIPGWRWPIEPMNTLPTPTVSYREG